MPLQPDQTLLHYRLIEKIGEGGMGVVWKAEDTSLHREVAIKVLPAVVSQDPERLVRFDREAKLLASLNHANIASVYGLHEAEPSAGTEQAVRFLAMEFVQGQDLAKRLARGRMSVADALGIARQVADALQSAHENGVVHRDLKPANILLTPEGQAKVLDFGLAKAFEADPSAPVNPTLSPTLTSAGTAAGVILGTAAYMSPEQARGEPADKRTDVWAFGCLLFEMLAGRTTFKERTISDTLASVLKVEPDWSLLPADTPESIRRLLQRCIQKDPRRRLHDIADARIEIEETLAAPHQARPAATVATETPRPRARLALTAVLVLLGLAAGLVVGRKLVPSAPEQRVRRFFLPVVAGEGQKPLEGPVISPDGRTIAYVFDDKLWLRDLDQVKPRALDGTAGASLPFWSPDGSQIGYRVDESLWRIPTSGGQPTLICNQAPDFFPGSWGPDQTIVFSELQEIFEVPARGGEPSVILERNKETENHFHGVQRLPDGRSLVFVLHRDGGVDTIALWADGERRVLLTLESSDLDNPTYSTTGHILFTRARNNEGVWALPFSLSSLEVTGEPFLVVPQGGVASASADGTLVYVDERASQDVELVWFDAEGTVLGTIGQPQEEMWSPVLSPDGTKVAVVANENNDWDIWIHDVAGHKNRLTFDTGQEGLPRWSPDGSRIFYEHPTTGKASIYTVEADGSGKRRLLTEGRETTLARSGAHMVFNRPGEKTQGDLWSISLEDDGEPVVFLQTEAEEQLPALSPDGRFVAYVSDESGRGEIYIKPFPEGSGKWQVSEDAGFKVYWSPAGDRLYFISFASLMEVEVRTDPVLRLGTPRLLIDREETKLTLWRGIAITEDGTRFVGTREQEADQGEEEVEDGIHVVENWSSDFAD